MRSAPDLIVESVQASLCGLSDQTLLLGCSGGVDSMVLARTMLELGQSFEVAHVDYGLRLESAADAELVARWCGDHDVPVHVLRAGTAPKTGSLQAWARNVRYHFFAETVAWRELAAVLVAHHADDQAETVALAQERGGGVDGLSGMSPVAYLPVASVTGRRYRLLRPLLETARSTIESAAEAWNVPYRSDKSNEDMRFRRAVVRRDMTALRREVLLRTARSSQKQAEEWLDELPVQLVGTLTSNAPDYRRIPLEALQELSDDHRAWYLLRLAAALHPAAPRRRSWVDAVNNLVQSPPGSRLSVGVIEGVRDRESIFVYSKPFRRRVGEETQERTVDLPLARGERLSEHFGVGTLRISRLSGRRMDESVHSTADTDHAGMQPIWLDPASVVGRVRVRRWAAGDRFTPLGAQGSTKIKALLTGSAVPPSLKPYVPVLVDDAGIMCVPGYRAAERFRARDATQEMLCVEWEPGSAYFQRAPDCTHP